METNKQVDPIESKIEEFPFYIIKYFQVHKGTWQVDTFINYIADIKEFLNWLCHEGFADTTTIKDIDVSVLNELYIEDIADYKSYLQGLKAKKGKNKGFPLSISTINRKLAALKSLFNFLVTTINRETRQPYIERNVMAQLPLLKDDKTDDSRADNIRKAILVDEEIKEFREFVAKGYGQIESIKENKQIYNRWLRDRERDKAIISLLLGTGLRISELASLNIKDVDLKERTILVRRKGNELQSVYFSKNAFNSLRAYLDIRNSRYQATDEVESLFVTLYGGEAKGLTKRAMQKLIEKYAVAFGKRDLTAHKLRHTFATNHAKKVRSIPILQKILNHKDPKTTMIYTQVLDSEIRESIDQADE